MGDFVFQLVVPQMIAFTKKNTRFDELFQQFVAEASVGLTFDLRQSCFTIYIQTRNSYI